jgi:hypothetical protein
VCLTHSLSLSLSLSMLSSIEGSVWLHGALFLFIFCDKAKAVQTLLDSLAADLTAFHLVMESAIVEFNSIPSSFLSLSIRNRSQRRYERSGEGG